MKKIIGIVLLASVSLLAGESIDTHKSIVGIESLDNNKSIMDVNTSTSTSLQIIYIMK